VRDTIDAEALERFCEAEHPRLFGLLTLYLGDREVAEQLAQDALVRLCQHWSRVRRMEHPRAWLTRVALNGATSWSRRRAAERRALARHGPDADVARPSDTATTVAVREALARLPEGERRVVVLRFYGGLDVRATARAVGRPEGTVKSMTHRAVARLRDELAFDLETDDVH
jgi:RNA polymerase sigma-70 factor (sigma-E family)